MIALTGVRGMVKALTGRRMMVVALTVATGALVVGAAVGKLWFDDSANSGWLGVL